MPDDAKMTEGERIAKELLDYCYIDPPAVDATAHRINSALATQRAELEAEIGRLRGMLREVEWSKCITGDWGACTGSGACPICEGQKNGPSWNNGHTKNCELAAILKEPTNARQPCQHNWVYHPDPSGNNDSHYRCTVCDKYSSRRPDNA